MFVNNIDNKKLVPPHEWAGARAIEKGETSFEDEIECFDGSHKIILDSAVPLHNQIKVTPSHSTFLDTKYITGLVTFAQRKLIVLDVEKLMEHIDLKLVVEAVGIAA